MIKFIGKLIKWVFIVVIGFGVLAYLFSDDKQKKNIFNLKNIFCI